jgi:hypothetical protein
MSITYVIDWNGLEWGDDEESDHRRTHEPPGWNRPGSVVWMEVRKENNEFRVIIQEDNVSFGKQSPEKPGLPPFLFFGPKAEIKIRTPTLQTLGDWMTALYPQGVQVTEQLASKEWAVIGAFNGGEIPDSHRLVLAEPEKAVPEAWN